jgi:hypothetical protein
MLGGSLVETLPRQGIRNNRRIVGRVVFSTVRDMPNEIRQFSSSKIFFLFYLEWESLASVSGAHFFKQIFSQ